MIIIMAPAEVFRASRAASFGPEPEPAAGSEMGGLGLYYFILCYTLCIIYYTTCNYI